MFTGIVTDIGTITTAEQRGDLRLIIQCGYDMGGVDMGASIACSGCCLTVVDKGADWFAVDASAETVSKTATGMWTQGRRLNLERALKLGDELGGHIVTGHVDGVAEATEVSAQGESTRMVFAAPKELARFIAAKGSVALEGVSLTVNEVEGAAFSVNIIPHTARVTNLGAVKKGSKLNLEADMMMRYLARLKEAGS